MPAPADRAAVFDLDGVIVDSEHLWDEVRERLAADWGGTWHARAQQEMMGMSSPEWSRYMRERIGIDRPEREISDEVVRRLLDRLRDELPLLPGAVEAVRRLAAAGVALAVASSANRPVIETVLGEAGLAALFRVTVSSEEVARGKPAPDVYLEAASRLGVPPGLCVAIEDSSNGLRAAHAAGMGVLAFPNRRYPPAAEALALADGVLGTLDELSPDLVAATLAAASAREREAPGAAPRRDR